MQPVVAVDLGGTNLRAAFYPQGIPPAKRTLRTPSRAERGPEAVLAAMAGAVREVLPDPFPPGLCVGVAAPGPLDPIAGVVLNAPNLPGWIDVPLRSWLQDALGVPVRIGNDANLAALGEWRYGAGQGVDHLVYLTISTGIGGGVISDGRLIVGWRALAGLVHIFNPQRIILGGGVARAGEVFWEPTRRTLQAEVMNAAFLEGVDLVPAALGDDAGLVGALVLATLP
jgi:predicted NBD/HSP70 family sugar kinase